MRLAIVYNINPNPQGGKRKITFSVKILRGGKVVTVNGVLILVTLIEANKLLVDKIFAQDITANGKMQAEL